MSRALSSRPRLYTVRRGGRGRGGGCGSDCVRAGGLPGHGACCGPAGRAAAKAMAARGCARTIHVQLVMTLCAVSARAGLSVAISILVQWHDVVQV